MLRSKVMLLEHADQLLLAYPALVKQMQLKDSRFLPSLLKWIDSAENLLVQNKIPQTSGLSGIKAKILTPVFDDKIRVNRRKEQTKVASQLMFDLQDILQDAIHGTRAKVEQASDAIGQLLSVLAQSSSENGDSLHYKKNEDINAFVERIWFVVCNHQQLKSTAVQLKGIMSESDIKLLITREIDLSLFMPAKKQA